MRDGLRNQVRRGSLLVRLRSLLCGFVRTIGRQRNRRFPHSMKQKGLQFYHRYSEDGSCKVICMYCYATLGFGPDRAAVTEMEAAHTCGEWIPAAERDGRAAEAQWVERSQGSSDSPLLEQLVRLHPAILLPAIAILLYGVPTMLEILARTRVTNTWLAVVLPGDAVGCAVLMVVARKPRLGLLLYGAMTALECYWHIRHVMRGVTMAWVADLVPTLVVMGILLMRLQRSRGMNEAAFS